MAQAYGWADLVIGRAGALTIAELCAAGVGSILVPFPGAVDDAAKVVRGLAERGVRARDRSGDPGSGQCIRMTAGILEDTRRAIAALEEVV